MNSTRLSVLSGLLLLLAACATTTPVSATPIEASTLVMVPCKIPIPQRTPFAVDTLPIGASIWDQMAALRAERLQRIDYIEELEAAVKGCQQYHHQHFNTCLLHSLRSISIN